MHDWNEPETTAAAPERAVLVVDETLRDGLQSPSVEDPPTERKVDALHAMAAIGVDVVSVGLPAAHPRAADDAVALLREIDVTRLPLRPTVAARTVESDVRAAIDVSQRGGRAVEIYAFIGSSPIRHLVEDWDVAFIVSSVRAAATLARRAGLPLCLVTEDTTRASPAVLTEVFTAAIGEGAARLCLCDTVGHATPRGVTALVGFVRTLRDRLGASHVGLDWHGHNDRGLAVANALWAARSGVDRVHGTALGIGERVGNVATEQLVFNLGALGLRPYPDMDRLRAYSDLAADLLGWEIPPFEPLVGMMSRSQDENLRSSGVMNRVPAEVRRSRVARGA